MINSLTENEIRKLRQLLRTIPCNGVTTYTAGEGITITDTTCCNIKEITTAPAYRVYSALLTQSGTDTEDSINSGELTIGVTYTINQNSPGMDFTNVGAPNNNIGTKFVATGTTPNSWGSGATYTLAYSAGAPVVTVLENTIGNIWFTYTTDGTYAINSDGLFAGIVPTVTDVFGVIESSTSDYLTVDKIDNSILRLVSSDSGYVATNALLNSTPIEIKVYN